VIHFDNPKQSLKEFHFSSIHPLIFGETFQSCEKKSEERKEKEWNETVGKRKAEKKRNRRKISRATETQQLFSLILVATSTLLCRLHNTSVLYFYLRMIEFCCRFSFYLLLAVSLSNVQQLPP
jgi:hypothetical protein